MPGGFPIAGGLCNGADVGTDASNSRGTSVASGTAAYGSYTQLIASTAADTSWMIVALSVDVSFSSDWQFSAKLAVGGSGNEVDIIKDLMWASGHQSFQPYSFPISIPAGTRIAAATATQHGSTGQATYIQCQVFDAGFAQTEGYGGIDSIGFFGASNPKGTALTGGAANTKGSYSQLTASTSRDYSGILITGDALNTGAPGTLVNGLIDLAIGGSGSENIIVPNWYLYVRGADVYVPSPFLPIAIPSGTRLSARWQESTGSQQIGLTVYGVYK